MSESNLTADEFAAIKRDWPETLICAFGAFWKARELNGPHVQPDEVHSVHGDRQPAKPPTPERPDFYAPGQRWTYYPEQTDTATFTLIQPVKDVWQIDYGNCEDFDYEPTKNLKDATFVGHHEPRQGDSFVYGPDSNLSGMYWGTVRGKTNANYVCDTIEGVRYIGPEKMADLIATHQIELATPINLIGEA